MSTTTPYVAHTSAHSERSSINDIVRKSAGTYIQELYSGYRAGRSDAVGMLARLRRSAGKPVHAVPDVWGMTGTDVLYDQIKDPVRLERAENAVHIAVTLFALHQQSHRDQSMHAVGSALGRSVRKLMPSEGIDESIQRRFVRIGTATSLPQLAQRLREIVSLLRSQAVPLDYAALAEQLYRWQDPRQRGEVQREWGRAFHTRVQSAHQPETSQSDVKES